MAANSLPRRMIKRLVRPFLHDNSYSYLQMAAMSFDIVTGNWYEPELDLIEKAVKAGDTVLDIGANFGLYSYHLSKAVGQTGQVYAFEPIPYTYLTLGRIARLLRFKHNLEIIPKGAGERAEVITFHVPLNKSVGTISAGLAFIGSRDHDHEGKETQVRWDDVAKIQAELVAIDEWIPENREISFIKCDVEGAELFAFRGAQRIIKKYKPVVVCEINPFYLKGFGLSEQDLLNFFFNQGYKIHKFDDVSKKLIPAEQIIEDNYVFVHPDRPLHHI